MTFSLHSRGISPLPQDKFEKKCDADHFYSILPYLKRQFAAFSALTDLIAGRLISLINVMINDRHFLGE
jgi:hypothetical protein